MESLPFFHVIKSDPLTHISSWTPGISVYKETVTKLRRCRIETHYPPVSLVYGPQELYSGGKDCNILAWVPVLRQPGSEEETTSSVKVKGITDKESFQHPLTLNFYLRAIVKHKQNCVKNTFKQYYHKIHKIVNLCIRTESKACLEAVAGSEFEVGLMSRFFLPEVL